LERVQLGQLQRTELGEGRKLNETDYTYDPTHGGVLTKTLPADANGIRPKTTYTYTQRYAWALNASGAYVQSAAPIWV